MSKFKMKEVISKLLQQNEESCDSFKVLSHNDTQIVFTNNLLGLFEYIIQVDALPNSVKITSYLNSCSDGLHIDNQFERKSAEFDEEISFDDIYEWFMNFIDNSDVHIESISDILESISDILKSVSSLPEKSRDLLSKLLEHNGKYNREN